MRLKLPTPEDAEPRPCWGVWFKSFGRTDGEERRVSSAAVDGGGYTHRPSWSQHGLSKKIHKNQKGQNCAILQYFNEMPGPL